MPAAVVVVAAAATGVAAAIGTAAVAAITTATVSSLAATAIGTGIIAGGVTAIQGGSTSDVLKSAVIAGIGSYVGGQVASKVTNSVSAATGGATSATTGATASVAPGSLQAALPGLGVQTAASTAGSTLIPGASLAAAVTPTALGFTAGQVAGRSVQAAITGQDIGEAALFGLASGVPVALNQSADFRSLDNTTKSVITASVQSAVMGQDVPEAAVSALVASSNIVAKAIREIPGGDQFIRENPNYARYVIDSVSSALTAELLNKDVNDAVINSLARTTGQLLASEFENSQREKEISETQQAYGRLEQKERELVMVQEQMRAVQENPRYAKAFKMYSEAANNLASAQDAYQSWTQEVSRLERAWDNAPEDQRGFIEYQYKQAVDWANYFASVYNQQEPFFETYRVDLAERGYFKEFGKLERQYNEIQREYDSIASSISNITIELAKTSADLFTETSRQTLSEIERLAEAGDVQMPSDADQFAQGMRIDITLPRIIYETSDKSVSINEDLGMFLDEDRTGDYKFAGFLTPKEFRDLTGRTVEQALASPTPIQDQVSVEDIAGIPSFTGTPALEAAALPFVVGVDLRKEVSPQAPVGTAIYRPADVSGTTGSGGGTSSTFQIIGRDRATGAEKVDVDGEGFTLIALPDNRQALVKDVGQVVLYPERDPVTNDVVLRPEPNPEIALKIISDASGGGGGGATQAPAPDNDRTGGAPSPSSQVLARQANQRALNRVLDMELAKLESQLQQAEAERYESEIALQRVLEQRGRFGNFVQVGGGQRPVTSTNARLSPETQRALEEEIRALESQLSESSRQIEDAAAERERFGALQQRTQDLSDEDILSFLESGEIPGGRGEGEPGAVGGLGGDQEGVDGGTGGGRGGGAGAGEGDGTGPGAGGGEGDLVPDVTLDEGLPRATVSLGPEIPTRPETTPFASRVTGQALEGILGEKEPLFGGDEDEQRAVWNRRSLRLLSRALGL